jgi:hypothetical protein
MDRRAALAALALTGLTAPADDEKDKKKKKKQQPAGPTPTPDVSGKWAGTWGPLDAKPDSPKKPSDLTMECTVTKLSDGGWAAVFEGECGRPYKYTIKMDGRSAPGAALFKGTTDLGEKDGGVFDWIGRADEKEFVGFYTSGGYVGLFRMTRPAAKPAAVPAVEAKEVIK